MKGVCPNKFTSNNLISHTHHGLKGLIQRKRGSIERRIYFKLYWNGIKHNMFTFRSNYLLYKIKSVDQI